MEHSFKKKRQLACIMFTDIVGYTALMGDNEGRTLTLLKENKEIHERLFQQYGGKLLKELGDGILGSFASVLDAVYCAGAIMEAVLEIPELNLSIGIHLGEVVFKEGDIYGDGVNIASRIQNKVPENSIWISQR